MTEALAIYSGARVRCRAEFGEGPRVGWLGTVVEIEGFEGMLLVTIAWDVLRPNRAQRRRGANPLHDWLFEDEKLASEYLEVLAVGNA